MRATEHARRPNPRRRGLRASWPASPRWLLYMFLLLPCASWRFLARMRGRDQSLRLDAGFPMIYGQIWRRSTPADRRLDLVCPQKLPVCTFSIPFSIPLAMSPRRSRETPTFQPAASQQRHKWTIDEDDYLRSQVEKFRTFALSLQ
jgi:hypothetical protein